MMSEQLYYLAFSLAPGIGPKRFALLLSYFGDAETAWNSAREDLEKAGIGEKTFYSFNAFRSSFNVQSYLHKLRDKMVKFLTIKDEEYPATLKRIDDPPIVLFIRGDIESIDFTKTIAVVGTRNVTRYGNEVTEQLVSELVSRGFPIVSGLALGVDAVAHRSSVENGGKTIAVLGCGVDCCYPRENEQLYRQIIEGSGAVVSEYPLSQPPSRGTFPARNRIIAGLSNGVLVTEAGADSGALITASNAASQRKPVFAVPGPITSRQSAGTAQLIKQGAILIQGAADILEHFGIAATKKKGVVSFENLGLTDQEKAILTVLEQEDMQIDDLSKKIGIDMSDLNQIISSLEIQGFVRNLGGVVGLGKL